MAIASCPVSVGAAGANPLAPSTQLIVVTTADWNAVDGHLQRYERARIRDAWTAVGEPIPIVVGKTGLAWGIGAVALENFRSRPIPSREKETARRRPASSRWAPPSVSRRSRCRDPRCRT
jgi:hypothetical protein